VANGLTPEQWDVLSAFAQEEPHRMQNLINSIKDGGQDLTALKTKIPTIHLDRCKQGVSRTH
jgi:DNA-binding MarR family transcriptional regulator